MTAAQWGIWFGTSAQDRAQNVLKEMRDGAVILLHDVHLDILIPTLKNQGYAFLTLSQLFQKKGVTPSLHDGKMRVYVE